MKYIATYDEWHGTGQTIEEAYEELKDTLSIHNIDGLDVEVCEFYEAEEIKVEMKIIKKAIPTKKETTKVFK